MSTDVSIDFLLGHMKQKLPMSDKAGNAIIEHLYAYSMILEKKVASAALAKEMVSAYGVNEQSLHVIQELGEFIAVFAKFLSGDDTWFRVAEEYSDALWVLEQVPEIVKVLSCTEYTSFVDTVDYKRCETIQTLKERLVDYYATHSTESDTSYGKFELP